MTKDQILSLIQQGESNALEFKASTASIKSAFESICAFLNNGGGTVLIGVKDQGQIVGQHITDKTKLEIANEIKKIEPPIKIHVSYVKMSDNKTVIAIHVPAGEQIPYVYDHRPYHRHESQTDKMPQIKYNQLLRNREPLEHSWESVLATNYTFADLDHEEIFNTVADGIRERRIPASAQRDDVKQVLDRLNLTEGNFLKRAAIVLFAKQDSMKLMQCMIKMARFRGTTKLGDFIDNQQVYGNAFKLLDAADTFLSRHLSIASSFKPDQFKRIDQPTLPVMAVREALINAICHRDYADYMTDTSLAIYDDHLEIWNSGILLKNLTVESLKTKHTSILRNKLIANVFYVRGLIERWGTGTNKIIDLCKQAGLPEPEFKENFSGISVIFKFAEPITPDISKKQKDLKEILTKRQKIILDFLKSAGQANTQEILGHLQSISATVPPRRTLLRELNSLAKLGYLKLHGTKKAALWVYLS